MWRICTWTCQVGATGCTTSCTWGLLLLQDCVHTYMLLYANSGVFAVIAFYFLHVSEDEYVGARLKPGGAAVHRLRCLSSLTTRLTSQLTPPPPPPPSPSVVLAPVPTTVHRLRCISVWFTAHPVSPDTTPNTSTSGEPGGLALRRCGTHCYSRLVLKCLQSSWCGGPLGCRVFFPGG